MTDYVAITETETNPGAPSRSSLWKRWAKNWIAGFEGAALAPRLWLRAIEKVAAGTQIRSRRDGVVTYTVSTTFWSFDFIQTGTIRLTYKHLRVSGTFPCTMTVQRTRNEVVTIIQSVASISTETASTLDFGILPGDRVQLGVGISGTASVNVYEVRLMTNGEDLWPGAYANVEGNRSAL
jgi:hypothetical protein